MELLFAIIYSAIVWVIFFKFKWLPWNITSQVIVVTIPVFAIMLLILFLNIFVPSSHDVRVINYAVQVVSRVAGRVTEVPVESDEPVKKGDVLFRIDATPYQKQVAALEAKVTGLRAKLVDSEAYSRELRQELKSEQGKRGALAERLQLAKKRKAQTKELATIGAGSSFDSEQAETDALNLESDLSGASARVSQVIEKLSAETENGELAEVAYTRSSLAQAEAELGEAQWRLAETTVYAPADGTVVNLQLRPGSAVAQFPITPAMSFIENEQWVLALFRQNELRYVKPGDEAEVALKTYPNRIIKCKVDSIIWASGSGQLPISGMVPAQLTTPMPPGYFAVRLLPSGEDEKLFLAAGAAGMGAIYTERGHMIHIVRKVFLRVGTKIDWLVLKLH